MPIRLRILTLALVAAMLGPLAGHAQLGNLRLPIFIDADATEYDGKTSMLRFTGMRLTQGNIGIEADLAHANRRDFDDSVWRFNGNVIFDVEDSHVTCDSADLEFSDFQLLVADIKGSPATFEFKRIDTEDVTYAEAESLYYDVAAGVIRFSGKASITEGGNVISSETLVYNIVEQKISAASSGNGDDRVTVTYTPPPADEAPVSGDDVETNIDPTTVEATEADDPAPPPAPPGEDNGE